MSEQSDHEKARALMRRLVEVADRELGATHKCGLGETFDLEGEILFGASLARVGVPAEWRQVSSTESYTEAVQQLITKTPWAGRVL